MGTEKHPLPLLHNMYEKGSFHTVMQEAVIKLKRPAVFITL